MGFANLEDLLAIEKEVKWEDRDLPSTLFGLLSRTAKSFPNRPAVSYQILSGPKDKAETLTWSELHAKTVQAANMFHSLGVGSEDVVAIKKKNVQQNNRLQKLFLRSNKFGSDSPPRLLSILIASSK